MEHISNSLPEIVDTEVGGPGQLPLWAFEGFDLLTIVTSGQVFMLEGREEAMWQHIGLLEEAAVSDDPKRIAKALNMFGSNVRLQWLAGHWQGLSPETVAALLPSAWTDPNMGVGGPYNFAALHAVEMIRYASGEDGFLTDGPLQPKELMLISHGIVSLEIFLMHDSWMNICWTTSQDVAISKFSLSGYYAVGIISPDNVIARFDNRGEKEVVIDSLDSVVDMKMFDVETREEVSRKDLFDAMMEQKEES